jgi:hypothetical protein
MNHASIAFGVEGVAQEDSMCEVASELLDACLRLGDLHLELRVGEPARIVRELTEECFADVSGNGRHRELLTTLKGRPAARRSMTHKRGSGGATAADGGATAAQGRRNELPSRLGPFA